MYIRCNYTRSCWHSTWLWVISFLQWCIFIYCTYVDSNAQKWCICLFKLQSSGSLIKFVSSAQTIFYIMGSKEMHPITNKWRLCSPSVYTIHLLMILYKIKILMELSLTAKFLQSLTTNLIGTAMFLGSPIPQLGIAHIPLWCLLLMRWCCWNATFSRSFLVWLMSAPQSTGD